MRLFNDNTGWEAARKSVRHTAAMLGASETHAGAAKALRQLLARWTTIDQERRDADDALVDANALVAWVDTQALDPLVKELGSLLLHEARQDRKHPAFKRYFPEPPNDVVRLGLESEIERTKAFFDVAEEAPPSKEAKALLAKMRAVHARGAEALTARAEAAANVARVALKMTTWKEDANGARRSIATMLDAHANERGMKRDYASAFFPDAPAAKAKKAADATPAPA